MPWGCKRQETRRLILTRGMRRKASPGLCSLASGRRGGFDEGAEEAALLGALGEILRMPLNADQKARSFALDALNDAVRLVGAHHDAGAARVHRLIMERVHPAAGTPQDFREATSGANLD